MGIRCTNTHLFNNDCILNTETNTVIYKGDDWEFISRVEEKNPQKDSDSLKEKLSFKLEWW